MALLSVDLTYRNHEYRIKESLRNDGVTVRMSEKPAGCPSCPRVLKPGTRCLYPAHRCIPCAIRAGALVHMERCQEQDAIMAALAKVDAAEKRLEAALKAAS